jgi:hypothetical protein
MVDTQTSEMDDHQKHAQPRARLLPWPGQAEVRAMPATATSNSPWGLSRSRPGPGHAVSGGPASSLGHEAKADRRRMSSPGVGSAVGRLAGARVGDPRVGAQATLVA